MWCRYLNIAPELSITRLYEVQQKDKLKYGSYMNTYWLRITNIDIYNDILGIEGNCDANPFPYNTSLFTMLSMFLSSLSNVSYGSVTMFIHSDKKL